MWYPAYYLTLSMWDQTANICYVVWPLCDHIIYRRCSEYILLVAHKGFTVPSMLYVIVQSDRPDNIIGQNRKGCKNSTWYDTIVQFAFISRGYVAWQTGPHVETCDPPLLGLHCAGGSHSRRGVRYGCDTHHERLTTSACEGILKPVTACYERGWACPKQETRSVWPNVIMTTIYDPIGTDYRTTLFLVRIGYNDNRMPETTRIKLTRYHLPSSIA